jgi:sterol 3beta-glucosyltransferase
VRVVIVTAGSRGDVAPFTGLGQGLQQDGHQVAVAAHQPFAALVRECGLEYRALPGDPVALVRARIQAASPQAVQESTEAFLSELGGGILAAVADAEVVLTAFGAAPLSRLAGEALGIPVLGTYLAPAIPTRAGDPDWGVPDARVTPDQTRPRPAPPARSFVLTVPA